LSRRQEGRDTKLASITHNSTADENRRIKKYKTIEKKKKKKKENKKIKKPFPQKRSFGGWSIWWDSAEKPPARNCEKKQEAVEYFL